MSQLGDDPVPMEGIVYEMGSAFFLVLKSLGTKCGHG